MKGISVSREAPSLEDMGPVHAMIAIATVEFANLLGPEYELDTDGHSSIWATHIKTGKQYIFRAFEVEQN